MFKELLSFLQLITLVSAAASYNTEPLLSTANDNNIFSIKSNSDSPVFLALKDVRCPTSHHLVNKLCLHKYYKFSFKQDSGLTQALPYIDNDQDELLLQHYTRISVIAKDPKTGKTFPASGISIYIIPGEKDQSIHFADPENGKMISKKIPAYYRQEIKTNIHGVASFAFDIKQESDLKLQKMLIRSDFMGDQEYEFFAPDQGTFFELSKITAQDLKNLKNDLADETANDIAESVRMLAKHVLKTSVPDKPYNSFDGEITSNSLSVYRHDEVSDFASNHWQERAQEIIKTIKIGFKEAGKVIVAVVETAKRVVEWVVRSAIFAALLLVQIIKLAGLFLLGILDAIKFVFHWDEVLNTQVYLNKELGLLHQKFYQVVNVKRDEVLKVLRQLKGSVEQQFDLVIDWIRGRQPNNQSTLLLEQASKGSSTVWQIQDAIDNGFQGGQVNATQKDITVLDEKISSLQSLLLKNTYPELAESLAVLRKGLTRITTDFIATIFIGLRSIMGILGQLAVDSADSAIMTFNIINDIVWLLFSLEVYIPLLTGLFKKIVSNGHYGISLLNLFTLTPSILYTYAYMIVHFGKAPFPQEKPSVNPPTPSPSSHEIEPAPLPPSINSQTMKSMMKSKGILNFRTLMYRCSDEYKNFIKDIIAIMLLAPLIPLIMILAIIIKILSIIGA